MKFKSEPEDQAREWNGSLLNYPKAGLCKRKWRTIRLLIAETQSRWYEHGRRLLVTDFEPANLPDLEATPMLPLLTNTVKSNVLTALINLKFQSTSGTTAETKTVSSNTKSEKLTSNLRGWVQKSKATSKHLAVIWFHVS